MDLGERAALESPVQQVRRAAGLLKEAARSFAQLSGDDVEIVGTHRVHDAESAEAASELIAHGRGQHGAVDVVVIARPGRRGTPPRPAQGEGDHRNGNRQAEKRSEASAGEVRAG